MSEYDSQPERRYRARLTREDKNLLHLMGVCTPPWTRAVGEDKAAYTECVARLAAASEACPLFDAVFDQLYRDVTDGTRYHGIAFAGNEHTDRLLRASWLVETIPNPGDIAFQLRARTEFSFRLEEDRQVAEELALLRAKTLVSPSAATDQLICAMRDYLDPESRAEAYRVLTHTLYGDRQVAYEKTL